jgi:(E)-4-hydroxy-3-methylbut-2-enyl-diphosphate synthase
MELIRPQLLTFSDAHLSYKRLLTHEVAIGNTPVGGHNPIRIQSMTTTDTMDTIGTVEQTLRLVAAGCEYVRITAPSKKEAENLAEIKKELRKRGCDVPLVADIHYTPNAAEIAAHIVEKVRVNPGNYADKKRFKNIEYTDASYQEELDRIFERFSPLVKICKENGTAMRIGTNHGSLSDRIMSRYGDTPEGMVESAMEFVRICEAHNFHQIVISMKASNPQVMVQAYRMLVQEMKKQERIYPLHLGVTEAGEGEDGRIKSALGISTLLMDGIGDTVRVSLTEEPEHELPVARFLIQNMGESRDGRVENRDKKKTGNDKPGTSLRLPFDPFSFKRRESQEILNLGGQQVPRVFCDLSHAEDKPSALKAIGYDYSERLDKYNFSDIAADYVFLGNQVPTYELPGGLNAVFNYNTWNLLKDDGRFLPFYTSIADLNKAERKSEKLNFVQLTTAEIDDILEQQDTLPACAFVLHAHGDTPAYEWREMIYRLANAGMKQPIILKMSKPANFDYFDDSDMPAYVQIDEEAKTQLYLASAASSLLVDGLVDGLWVDHADEIQLRAAFGMLQLSRLRITKTEYISCPSCGRTLFDLQETTAKIRARTEHLKGVKIGIMGCIVNGPGEMADADFGYVGSGPGKITLYRGQEVVKRSVPTAQAVDELIDLIKEDGRWVDN